MSVVVVRFKMDWHTGNSKSKAASSYFQCVVPEIIHTSPTEGIFPKTPSTPLEIPIELRTFP